MPVLLREQRHGTSGHTEAVLRMVFTMSSARLEIPQQGVSRFPGFSTSTVRTEVLPYMYVSPLTPVQGKTRCQGLVVYKRPTKNSVTTSISQELALS